MPGCPVRWRDGSGGDRACSEHRDLDPGYDDHGLRDRAAQLGIGVIVARPPAVNATMTGDHP